MLRKPVNQESKSNKLSRNRRLKYSLDFAIRQAGNLRRVNFHQSEQTMSRANPDTNKASSSGNVTTSGDTSGDRADRRGPLLMSITPKLRKILGISSVDLRDDSRERDEQEPRSQSACSGCFSSIVSNSSGSTASLPSKSTRIAEKLAKKGSGRLEKEQKVEQERLKAEQKRNPSPCDQLPTDSEIRDYFFHYKKVVNDRPPTTRTYDAAQVRAVAASFEAATAKWTTADPVAGPSSRSHSRLFEDYDRTSIGTPRNSRPSSRINCHIRYPKKDEEYLADHLISSKSIVFKKD